MKREEVNKKLEIVLNRMFEANPSTSPQFRPFMPQRAVTQSMLFGSEVVDLKKVYGSVYEGDRAYAVFCIDAIYEKNVYISLRDNSALFVNGKKLWDGSGEGKFRFFEIVVGGKCNTEVIIESVCKNGKFGFEYSLTTPEYQYMWTKDYNFCMRKCFPQGEYFGEEGIAFSRKFSAMETEQAEAFVKGKREYVYPTPTKDNLRKDMGRLYRFKTGNTAYAVTYAARDGSKEIAALSPTEVFINKKPVLILCSGEKAMLRHEQGDEILVRSEREGVEWGFYADDEGLSLPFLRTGRKYGACWLMIGAFCGRNFAVEESVRLDRVYFDSERQAAYFRFPDGRSFLRPYQNTCLFGQWYYAVMCCHFGILKVALNFGKEECRHFFLESMKILSRYFDYAKYDKEQFHIDPSILPRSTELNNLDNIGTVGLNAAEAYLMTGEAQFKSLAMELAEVLNDVPRSAEGLFHRQKTMWADDLFMACPFLLRMWKITGNQRHLDTAAAQLTGYGERMLMREKGLFSHIYFRDKEMPSGVAWGRGNGWVLIALAEFLEYAPPGHESYETIKEMFCFMCRSVLKCQNRNDVWHNVLDEPGSYEEASCSVMFLYAISKGIRLHILNGGYLEAMERAWAGINKRFLDEAGNLRGICSGSGCSDRWEYYNSLKTITNDEHGTGLLLAAMCEYYKIL